MEPSGPSSPLSAPSPLTHYTSPLSCCDPASLATTASPQSPAIALRTEDEDEVCQGLSPWMSDAKAAAGHAHDAPSQLEAALVSLPGLLLELDSRSEREAPAGGAEAVPWTNGLPQDNATGRGQMSADVVPATPTANTASTNMGEGGAPLPGPSARQVAQEPHCRSRTGPGGWQRPMRARCRPRRGHGRRGALATCIGAA
mmetsp:Transcript_89741/g.231695  ORF Transcript_89741/g.231695 Transcript_89741/m.231695 type:complete len:200 (-) Transcript_89741:106-705(-)